ncbi:MAG: exodeoxyribonuclease III [Polyangiales bacterium]
MKLATWNVNSIRVRKDQVIEWLNERRVDVLCLQELKCTEDQFPFSEFEAIGYHATVHGQKTYNGVAILSLKPLNSKWNGLSDPQARLIAAEVDGVEIVSAYFPNGGSIGSDKYAYKLEWMSELATFLGKRDFDTERFVLCGDFNVAPFDDDVAVLEDYAGGVLTSDDVRKALGRISDLGLTDVFRPFFPDGRVYSWWDYRGRGFERNHGLRIDHVFASRPMAEKAIGAIVDRHPRMAENASDHAPVIVEFG